MYFWFRRRLTSIDSGREPLAGERVTYFLAPGRPSETLIGCVRASQEVWSPLMSVNSSHSISSPALNLTFYLDHQLLPPLRRFTQLVSGTGWNPDTWLCDLPRLCHNHRQFAASVSSSFSQSRRPSSIMRAFLRPPQLCPGCGIDCPDGGGKFGYCQQCRLQTASRFPHRVVVAFGSEVTLPDLMQIRSVDKRN